MCYCYQNLEIWGNFGSGSIPSRSALHSEALIGSETSLDLRSRFAPDPPWSALGSGSLPNLLPKSCDVSKPIRALEWEWIPSWSAPKMHVTCLSQSEAQNIESGFGADCEWIPPNLLSIFWAFVIANVIHLSQLRCAISPWLLVSILAWCTQICSSASNKMLTILSLLHLNSSQRPAIVKRLSVQII